jgi:hypothetical protein
MSGSSSVPVAADGAGVGGGEVTALAANSSGGRDAPRGQGTHCSWMSTTVPSRTVSQNVLPA